MSDEKYYPIVLKDDNSLKQLFDRFYVIPKDYSLISDADRSVLEKYNTRLFSSNVAAGKNGYIVFRGKKSKKLNQSQIDEIISDNISTQRDLAFKYNVCVATINKIKKGKY